jgi:type IV pilus assembly protein PilP
VSFLRFAPLALTLCLAGCGGERFEDLQIYMDQAGNDGKSKIEPLPEVKPLATFEYRQDGLEDPFQPRNLTPSLGKGGLQPDLSRPREPLEEFPLDGLRLVGTIQKPGKPLRALIKDPQGIVHTVGIGNRLGQNFGVITKLGEDGLEIKELVQDGAGEWAESKATMTLAE